MKETVIYSAIISGVGVVIWFFIRRMINRIDKKFDLLFNTVNGSNREVAKKIDTLQKNMHSYALTLEGIKTDNTNVKETVIGLKTDIKHVWNRFDKQKIDIDKNRDSIVFVKAAQENCPARNEKIK